MKLVRWNPAREFEAAWKAFDQAYEDEAAQPRRWGLALDVTENDEDYSVQASVPGVSPEDIEITFEKNVLTVRGESKADETINSEDYRLRERRVGRFSRSLRFPVEVDTDKVTADYEHGILTLRVPKAEAVKPKKIAVSINSK
jgi:HSP20 family protein